MHYFLNCKSNQAEIWG